MWRLIPGPIRRAVSWLLGAIAFGAVWFAMGSRDRALRATNKALKGNIKTRKRMDEAEIADDHHHAIEWLSKRDPKQR